VALQLPAYSQSVEGSNAIGQNVITSSLSMSAPKSMRYLIASLFL